MAAAALLLTLAAAGPDRVACRGGPIEVPGLMATPDRVTLRLQGPWVFDLGVQK